MRFFICALLIASAPAAFAQDNPIAAECRLIQQMDPENTQGGAAECECVAEKLEGILTPYHFSVAADFATATIEVNAALPHMDGPEFFFRTLKAVSVSRGENPTDLNFAVGEMGSVRRVAYSICGVIP